MSYEVLALKYRPKVFEDLVGQEAVTRTLTNAIQQGRIANAFVFSGVRGVGKTTTARILAKALNCASGPTVRPCGECASCKEIPISRSLDVLEIDGASQRKVGETQELLATLQYAPSRDRFKILIVDEVHMFSPHSFNALLKTLEEPPPHVKFIFATTESHKIPDTILSRCQEFEFRTVSGPEMAHQLQKIASSENIVISEAALATLARVAEGSLRDGISALDQVVAAVGTNIEESEVTEILGLPDRDVLRATARAIVERDTASLLRIVDGLVSSGRDLRFFVSAMTQFLRDVLVARVAPDVPELVELPQEAELLQELAGELSEEDLLRSLDVLTETETALRTSAEPRFHLEIALLKLSQLRRLASFEELLARFEALVSGGVTPAPAGASGGSRKEPASAKATAGKPRDAGSAPFVDRLAERLRASKPMLHALVSRHHAARERDGGVTLVFQPEQRALAEQLQERELAALLDQQASELSGEPFSVTIEIQENGRARDAASASPAGAPVAGESDAATRREGKRESGSTSGPEPAAADEDLRERANQDPMVRRFVETFQGEVEKVRRRNRE